MGANASVGVSGTRHHAPWPWYAGGVRGIASVALFALALCAGCRSDDGAVPVESRSAPGKPTPVQAPKHSSGGAVVAAGPHLYWIAGTTGSPSNLARRFNTKTKVWESLPSAGVSRLQAAGASVGPLVLVAGGMRRVTKHSDAIEAYDTVAHTWTTTASLPDPLAKVAMVAVGETAFVFGGVKVLNASLASYDSESVRTAVALTDGGTKLEVLPSMPTARESAAAVAVRGKVWVLGGRVTVGGSDEAISNRTDVVEIYDPTAKTWTDGPALPRAASGYGVHVAGTVVVFGEDLLNPLRPMVLDVASGVWTVGEERDRKVVGGVVDGAVVIEGAIYVLSTVVHGLSEPSEPHVCTYDPAKDAWTVVD